jgi:hypothetical protein
MFWSIFFIGNNQAARIDPFDNQLTLLFGYLIIGMFNITSITIFINMLIASMVRSYVVILVRILFLLFHIIVFIYHYIIN